MDLFSNYNSNKAEDFAGHNQITGLFFGIKQIRKFELKPFFKKRNQVF